jgi:hypothetical protein
MSALLEFECSLAARWSPEAWRDVPVLVAVSGGADSVALLRGLNELKSPGARLVVAHFNHRLRATESDRDEQFVADLAGKLGLPIGCSGRRTNRRHRPVPPRQIPTASPAR